MRTSVIDPSKAQLPDYVLVFKDDMPPKESQFRAVCDDQATGLMQKQYPAFAWTLYRLARGQRQEVCSHPAEIQANPDADPAFDAIEHAAGHT
jgi:hypothetical protein